MTDQRILTLGVNEAPIWRRLRVDEIGPRWAAIILPDEEHAGEAGAIRGLALFGVSAEAAREAALRYLEHAGLLTCPRCGSLQAVALTPRRSRRSTGGGGRGGAAREYICKDCGESWMSCHGTS
jgi:hypothetical protein